MCISWSHGHLIYCALISYNHVLQVLKSAYGKCVHQVHGGELEEVITKVVNIQGKFDINNCCSFTKT